jgi:hypothetical protein
MKMEEDKIIRRLDPDWQFFFLCILVVAILGVIALLIWTWQTDFVPKAHGLEFKDLRFHLPHHPSYPSTSVPDGSTCLPKKIEPCSVTGGEAPCTESGTDD